MLRASAAGQRQFAAASGYVSSMRYNQSGGLTDVTGQPADESGLLSGSLASLRSHLRAHDEKGHECKQHQESIFTQCRNNVE